MAGFNDFVQTELPLRPFVANDGSAGQMLVRSPNALAARELVWVDVPNSSGQVTGTSMDLVAAMALGGHRVVSADAAGKAIYADMSDAATVPGAIGITSGAAAMNDVVTVITSGAITEPTWGFTPYAPVFLTGQGQLSQTAPTVGPVLQVGIPLSPTKLLVSIKFVANLI